MDNQYRDVPVVTIDSGSTRERTDAVAREEPLDIRVRTASDPPISVAVTMRTPGSDAELASGFLWGEGLLATQDSILITCESGPIQAGGFRNGITITLAGEMPPGLADATRRFYMTSSCGICGRSSIDAIAGESRFVLSKNSPVVSPGAICAMPDRLRSEQETFERTGGLHAAGLFGAEGQLLSMREDVGRHNAVDKIVGQAVLQHRLPLSDCVLFVSGRASFELTQKAIMAGIPVLAAVGAPSSLAIELARDNGLTLIGFVRGNRFNIYSAEGRIQS